jgi:O-6-methylguanine DNA methyltransferase
LQLDDYFSQKLKSFSIPLDLSGADFQSSIWQLLLDIPYGSTISYLALANLAGDPKKVRAVGRANGENRIAIIVPCHRVIGHDGKLVGYAGELWRKKKLLDMERANSGKPVQSVMEF